MSALEDRLDIDDVLTRYTIAIDRKDFALLDKVFTPDARLDFTSPGGPSGGLADVRTWLESVLADFEVTQHLVTNRLIEVDGDQATASSYLFNPMASGDTFFYFGGYYHDRLVRTPDGWRIAERKVEKAFMDLRS